MPQGQKASAYVSLLTDGRKVLWPAPDMSIKEKDYTYEQTTFSHPYRSHCCR